MQELLCPQCQKGSGLTTQETMVAYIGCDGIFEDGPEPSEEKEAFYESVEVTAVECDCGWRYEGPDWMNHLLRTS